MKQNKAVGQHENTKRNGTGSRNGNLNKAAISSTEKVYTTLFENNHNTYILEVGCFFLGHRKQDDIKNIACHEWRKWSIGGLFN